MEYFASQDPRSYSLYFGLNIGFRARKVNGTFEKRAPGQYALPTNPTRSGKPYPTPIQEAITNATDRIQNPILHLSKHNVWDLFQVRLNNMYFSFRDQVFRQREGLPMSSSILGILAILFMDKLENIALS